MKLTIKLMTALCAGILLFAACKKKKDECKDYTVCQNGGACIMEGNGFGGFGSHPACECAAGYDGDYCETESRVELYGNYILNGTDNHGGGYSNLNTTIATSALAKTKFILDVSGTFNLICSMSLPDPSSLDPRFTIDAVTISGFTYSGSGGSSKAISDDELSLSITKTGGINDTIYTLSGLKQ